MNIYTNEIYETRNLKAFVDDMKCDYGNLIKTFFEYKGKKRLSHSKGLRVIEKTELDKKIKVLLENIVTKEQYVVEDLKMFCKENNLNFNNLRKTYHAYEGIRGYSCKGYKILEYR